MTNLERRYKETESDFARDEISRYMSATPCEGCGGKRLKPEALSIKFAGLDITELSRLPLKNLTGLLRPHAEGTAPG